MLGRWMQVKCELQNSIPVTSERTQFEVDPGHRGAGAEGTHGRQGHQWHTECGRACNGMDSIHRTIPFLRLCKYWEAG